MFFNVPPYGVHMYVVVCVYLYNINDVCKILKIDCQRRQITKMVGAKYIVHTIYYVLKVIHIFNVGIDAQVTRLVRLEFYH